MKTPVLALLSAALLLNCSFTAQAQFGGLKDAARKAKEAMQKKKEAEAQAQKDAEAKKEAESKKEAETKETEAKKDGEAKKESSASSDAAAPPSFQAFSKFDFVPGEKIVAMDDFTQDAVGDFPAKWNTDASGEIVRSLASLGGG
jgi:OOP family OmpA-OmpF porin